MALPTRHLLKLRNRQAILLAACGRGSGKRRNGGEQGDFVASKTSYRCTGRRPTNIIRRGAVPRDTYRDLRTCRCGSIAACRHGRDPLKGFAAGAQKRSVQGSFRGESCLKGA